MARKSKRTRPSDPMAIARRRAAERARDRDPGAWGIDGHQLRLAANQDVETRTDPGGRIGRARRADVFDLFLARGKLSAAGHDAVRRLQDDMAIMHRTLSGGGGDFAPKVDRSRRPAAFSERRLAAGLRIDAALGLAGPASARLIAALCESEVVLGQPRSWRAVVQRETGERLADAQGALLRLACENLAGAYALIDRGRRRGSGPSTPAFGGSPGTPR
jgi:hypothetical protein